MSDETGVTGEVARVLAEAAPCRWSIPAPEHPHADACRHRTHDRGYGVCWDVACRQADALAEAGLLREAAPRAEPECPCAACDPGLFPGEAFNLPSRMNVCPDCGNKRCPKAANHARWHCNDSNEVGQVARPVEKGDS